MSVIIDRWNCCGKRCKTAYCPECGAKRPETSPETRAESLMKEFLGEAKTHRRAADTFDNQIEEILSEHEETEPSEPIDEEQLECGYHRTWADVVRVKRASAAERRRRALRYESWAGVIRDLLAARSVSVSVSR